MKNKNFLKKLTAGILGFVMTLGVGAAGYAASASETRATDGTVTFSFPSSTTGGDTITGNAWNTTYAEHRIVATASTGEKVYFGGRCANQSSSFAARKGKSPAEFIGNINPSDDSSETWASKIPTGTVGAIPGAIKGISWEWVNTTSSTSRGSYLEFSTSSRITSTSSTTAIKVSSGTSYSTSVDSTKGYKYFAIFPANSSFVGIKSITVTYEVAPTGFEISYNANKPAGVTSDVTGMPTTNPETGKTTFTKPSTNPSLSGYTFDGWYNAATGGTKYNGGETLSANLSLYAHWNINKELDHVALGGTLSTTTYTYGDSWSSSGLTLTAYYTDTTSATVTGSYSFDPATPTVGTTSVSITGSYGGKSDTKSYAVSVSKAQLSAPSPVFSAANKNITWENVPNASSYQVKIGNGAYATTTSPYDVSSYEGEGVKDFYIKAIGNSNYSDSAESHITFEVKASVQYKLVTSTDDLKAGSNYVIGTATSGSAVFMSTVDNANNRRQTDSIDVTNDGIMTATDEVLVLQLGGSSGAWTLQTTNYLGTNGYLAAATGKSNHCRVISDETTGTITFNDSAAIIDFPNSDGRTHLRYNSDQSSGKLFACYSSAQSPIYLFKEMSTKKSAALSASSVSNYKDLLNPNTDITVTCTNFTPEGLTFSYADGGESSSTHIATSQNVEVSTGAAVSGVYTLSILCKKVGTTNVKIDVSGATLDPLYLDVTVKAKPGSITSSFSTSGVNFVNKDSTSQSGYRSITPELFDTDGNKMTSTPASDVFDFAVTGNDHVHVSDGGRVHGDGTVSNDTVTITVSSKEIPTVTQSYTVKAIADYITGTWNVGGSLTKSAYNAGEEFNPADLAITAKYYFAGIQTVPYSDLLFTTSNQGTGKANRYSFNNDDALGENATTIYVYYGDSNEPVGSVGNITVTPSDIPMTGLAFKLSEDGAEVEETEMTRGDELTLIPVFKPSNTTDSRTLEWDVEQDGSGISVDSTGKITVAADATVGNVGYITASTTFEDKDQITAAFMVTVLREEQKVHVITEVEEEWTKVTSDLEDWSGEFLIVSESTEDGSVVSADVFNGRDETSDYVTYDVSNNKIVVGAEDVDPSTYKVTITKNNSSGGNYFLQTANPADSTQPYFGRSGTSNGLDFSSTGYDTSISIDDGDATITPNASVKFAFNNTSGQTRFRYYKNSTAEGNDYYLPQMYKKSGGAQEYDAIVSDTLFEAVVEASSYLNDDWELVEAALSDIITAGGEDLIILQHGVNLSTGNEVQKFLYNYDNLVVNSGEEDFLNRFVKHTVTFDSNGGSTVSPVTVVEGGKVTKPEDPTKTGYEFDKWYYENDEFDFNTPIMADITLTANWSERSYNVSFSGSNVTFTGDSTCKFGKSYSATLSAATGYSLPTSLTVTAGGSPFSGYLYNSSTGAFSITSMPANDISISGNATTVNYTISYNLDGGTALGTNPTSYTIESETITLFGASKTGCRFDGWYDSNNVKVTQIVKGSTGNISLTAKYTAETYNVSFTGDHVSSNGAATCEFGKPYSAIFTAEDSYILPSSITVKLNGEDFDGYDYSNVDGSFYIASMPAGNISISVTAQQGAYQITYKEVDGTVITEPQLVKEYEFGVGATLVNAQNRTGYKFVGWYSEQELVNKVESIAPTEKGNKIFYAKWAFAAQDALDSVQTSIGMSYTYQKDANAPIVSSSNPPTKVETKATNSENSSYTFKNTGTSSIGLSGKTSEQFMSYVEDEDSSGIITGFKECTNAYIGSNGGSGSNAWNVWDSLKIGKSSAKGSITLNLDSTKDFSSIIIHVLGNRDDGSITINGITKDVTKQAKPSDLTPMVMEFDIEGGISELTISSKDTSSYNYALCITEIEFVPKTATLDHIAIEGTPTTTTYNVGEAYSSTGLRVEAYYDGGTHETVTATITPSKQYAEAGDTSVTFSASYEGKTASLPVNVTVNSVYSNVSFKFNFKNTGMDALVSEYGDAFDDIGLVVEYGGRTRYFSFIPDDKGNYYIYEDGEDPTTFKMKDGGVFTMSLGDVINNLDRAATEFTVKAYIRDGENYYYSSNSTTYSVMSWISYYHSKSDYKDATEDLYNIFFPNAQ